MVSISKQIQVVWGSSSGRPPEVIIGHLDYGGTRARKSLFVIEQMLLTLVESVW